MRAIDAGRVTNGDSGLKREIAVIPKWAWIVAVAIWVCVPAVFITFIWPREGPETPVLRVLVPLLPATLFAFLVLMIGYVNKDAGRRGMSRTLWTLIVTFVPNAIGFILYFLLRNPIRSQCPNCFALVDPHVNYCPQCRYSFHPTCPHCKAAIQPGDKFCANCGAEVGGS